MTEPAEQPNLFSLMTLLTAEQRQKLGERRRAFKAQGAEERLVGDGKGAWRLEYWKGKEKVGEQSIAS